MDFKIWMKKLNKFRKLNGFWKLNENFKSEHFLKIVKEKQKIN
jgi:hypothetical protein